MVHANLGTSTPVVDAVDVEVDGPRVGAFPVARGAPAVKRAIKGGVGRRHGVKKKPHLGKRFLGQGEARGGAAGRRAVAQPAGADSNLFRL